MKRLALGIASLVALSLALAAPAAAHPLDIGYLRIDAEHATVKVALDIHVNAAARLTGVPVEQMDAAALAAHAGALADATLRTAPIVTSAGPCTWTQVATASLTGNTASLTGEARCPAAPRNLSWTLPFVADGRVSPTFQVLVKAQLAGEAKVAIADKTRPSFALAAHAAIGFASFVWTGIEHIGAAPSEWRGAGGWKLPDGIDHIMFLLALMLAGGSLIRILGIVSGFTLGHSITLALSALHVVRPPASIIEPLIALSIVLVAGEAMLGKFEGHRWKVASFFGLIHGFGFASALNQLDLSTGDTVQALFGYNLGVELGQVTIVLIAAPLILYLQRHRRFHPLVRTLAAAICIAGIYWFFQRL
ncbi:MAG TPA: HupE/UreJ family protein [Kofleriaceae bacterium]